MIAEGKGEEGIGTGMVRIGGEGRKHKTEIGGERREKDAVSHGH